MIGQICYLFIILSHGRHARMHGKTSCKNLRCGSATTNNSK